MRAICKLGDIILINYNLPKGAFLEGRLPYIIVVPDEAEGDLKPQDERIFKQIRGREYQITFVRKPWKNNEQVFYAEVNYDIHLVGILQEYGWQLSSVLPN